MQLNKILTLDNYYYHANAGYSRSQILEIKKSAYHFWYKYINTNYKKKCEESTAMLLGSAVHTAILEPDLFDKQYIVSPKFDRRTKDGKKSYDDFQLQAENKIVIDELVFLKIQIMRDALRKNPQATLILDNENNLYEKSIYWQDINTNILCKSRPDLLNIQKNLICDLKTTSDASERAFSASIYQRGYHIQAAMMIDALQAVGHEINTFVFLCVESVEPYATAIYILDNESIERGRQDFYALLQTIKRCTEQNFWPSYESKIIKLPNFVNYITENEE